MGQYYTDPELVKQLTDMKAQIAALQIGPPRLYAEQLPEISVGSAGPTFGVLSIQVTPGPKGLVMLFVQADMKSDGVSSPIVYLRGNVAIDIADTPILQQPAGHSTSYIAMATVPGSSTGVSLGGGGGTPLTGALIFPTTPWGNIYILGLGAGSGSATFRNLKMWAFAL